MKNTRPAALASRRLLGFDVVAAHFSAPFMPQQEPIGARKPGEQASLSSFTHAIHPETRTRI